MEEEEPPQRPFRPFYQTDLFSEHSHSAGLLLCDIVLSVSCDALCFFSHFLYDVHSPNGLRAAERRADSAGDGARCENAGAALLGTGTLSRFGFKDRNDSK